MKYVGTIICLTMVVYFTALGFGIFLQNRHQQSLAERKVHAEETRALRERACQEAFPGSSEQQLVCMGEMELE